MYHLGQFLRRLVAVEHTVVADHRHHANTVVREDLQAAAILRRAVLHMAPPFPDRLLVPPETPTIPFETSKNRLFRSPRSRGRVEQAVQAAGGGVGEAQQERPAAGGGEPPRWRLAADLGAVAVGDDEAAVRRQ